MYRAVKDLNSDDVIAIGMDEGQGGKPYHDLGTWCEFTFGQIPEIPKEIMDLFMEKKLEGKILLKVVENSVIAKTLEELQQ